MCVKSRKCKKVLLLMETFDDPIKKKKTRKSHEYKRVLTVLIHLVPGMSRVRAR